MADEDAVQGPTTDTDNGAAEPTENATPWASYLEPLPESVRPLVEPAFKQWDADVTQRFQKYSQELEPYKQWDPIIEAFQNPDTAQQAMSLLQAVSNDPEAVYRALAENYGFGDQGEEEPESDDPSEYVDPRIASLEQMTEAMAEILLTKQNEETQQQEDAALEKYLEKLAKDHGEFDQEYVLAHMHMGTDGAEAVKKYQKLVGSKVAEPAKTAPTLLGSGGGLPSQAINPADLSSKDIKNLIAQQLAQAAQAD